MKRSVQTSRSNISHSMAARWLAFGILASAGFVLYFSNNFAALANLNFLLLPDEILKMWSGGDWSYFRLSDRIEPTLIAAAWLAASWGAGRALLRLLPPLEMTPSERRGFEMAAGLAATSLLMLSLGLAGWIYPWLVRSLTLVLAALLALRPNTASVTLEKDSAQLDEGDSIWPRRVLWLAAPLMGLMWLSACMPPWEFDVMAYHLQVAKEWHAAGRITFLPHNVYGNMPLGAEMHPLATMTLCRGPLAWFYGALSGKIVLASFVLITAHGLWAAGSRWLSPKAGALAALLFLTVPLVFANGTIGHNEMVLACYGFYAWYAVARWTESSNTNTEPQATEPQATEPQGSERTSWLLVAGGLAGAAAACKYTGVAFIAAPLWLIVLGWRFRLHWKPAAWMLLASLAAGGLWYAKNTVHTGNPVYPLAYSAFGGQGWSDAKAERWKKAHFANGHHWRQLVDSASRIGWRVGGQGALTPALALFALSPWGWPRSSIRLRRWLAGLLLFAFVLWWLVTHRLERFLLPSVPLATLLAGGAAAQLDTAGWPRKCLTSLLAFVWILAMVAAMVAGDSRYFTALETLRKDPQLKRIHPTHLYVNSTDLIPPGQQLLMVADAQVFNLERPILYNSCWDDSPLTALVQGKSVEERRAALHNAKISHVFVHWGELERYREVGNYGYDPFITPKLFAELVEQGILREVPNSPSPDDQQVSSSLFEVVDGG